MELDFSDKQQKQLYDTVVNASKRVYELNGILEAKKDKSTAVVIQNEKEKLYKEIEDSITKVYRLEF